MEVRLGHLKKCRSRLGKAGPERQRAGALQNASRPPTGFGLRQPSGALRPAMCFGGYSIGLRNFEQNEPVESLWVERVNEASFPLFPSVIGVWSSLKPST